MTRGVSQLTFRAKLNKRLTTEDTEEHREEFK